MHGMNIKIYVNTIGSHFATVRFTTIHFYDSCPVGRNTPDLWRIPVATQASFHYLAPFQLFADVCVCFFFFYFSAVILSSL